MVLQLFHKRGKSGFTLVELLIVVAIIGVLSTVGIPTFRRMIQKSKKSEAKVNLGGVYTTQAAFSAEYNAFGNNLGKMGFEIDGVAETMHYTVGFFTNACAEVATIRPANAGTAAQIALFKAINTAFPAYYDPATKASRMGFTARTTHCLPAVVPVLTGDVNANSREFEAVASGVISPNFDRFAPADALHVDVWTINEKRVLSNRQDGVN